VPERADDKAMRDSPQRLRGAKDALRLRGAASRSRMQEVSSRHSAQNDTVVPGAKRGGKASGLHSRISVLTRAFALGAARSGFNRRASGLPTHTVGRPELQSRQRLMRR
jgi:hypothetical protein